jgi:hypothetical protein
MQEYTGSSLRIGHASASYLIRQSCHGGMWHCGRQILRPRGTVKAASAGARGVRQHVDTEPMFHWGDHATLGDDKVERTFHLTTEIKTTRSHGTWIPAR